LFSIILIRFSADANESNLRMAAYEALSNLIFKSPKDCIFTVQKTALVILERLEVSIKMESQLLGLDDRNQHADLQMALCGVVQVRGTLTFMISCLCRAFRVN
jgi:importin subunit beta-1